MRHSKTLEDTVLWRNYDTRISSDRERSNWIKKVYETAVVYLKDVRQTFINYTMHDETHILNVMDAMGGLLGDCIDKLTVGEIELIILAACLHDLGMVYTEEERKLCFEDETKCKEFLREHCPELLGNDPKEWPVDTRQWYLRTLHPFRIAEVLHNEGWKDLFEDCPNEIVPLRCVLAACQAHGENPKDISINKDLEYLPASDVDPLFCALLLRLADLLDFDDTRAPKVLYSYVECNEKSRDEWNKHQASAGFRYPDSPSVSELPYKARCKNPMIEHAVRDFLDWIDDELGNCIRLQRYCNKDWQKVFPLPRAVSRKEIESDGYMSGDFCLTMDQTQIMNLLMGENLYDNRDVFVRELLQNAIDATLLRGEMDSDFVPEQSRIDLWDWSDKEGNFWFRIDDQGTGMTLGMLQRYFLKVGNSYYNSRELEQDLRDHGQTKHYQGISRFGIGFLSCFLCGYDVEVSTLYFDREKNQREESANGSSQMMYYGLRLQVTGLAGYYTLKSQAEKHQIDRQLPMPHWNGVGEHCSLERYGYRTNPGTSIVIRLNPGKLGALNLRETVEKYLCSARVPVYYNNKRVGRTYEEVMQTVHEMAGENFYELTPELKKEFDDCFPALTGNYPKLVVTVFPLDTEENHILQDFSGVILKYNIHFEKILQCKVADQNYVLNGNIDCSEDIPRISLNCFNSLRSSVHHPMEWHELKRIYGIEETEALGKKLSTFSSCPQMVEQLGNAWLPFAGDLDLKTVWVSYQNYIYENQMVFNATELGCPNARTIFDNTQITTTTYVYQGVIAGKEVTGISLDTGFNAIFLFEGECKPSVEISRSNILSLPLRVIVTVYSILFKYQLIYYTMGRLFDFLDCEAVSLLEWRKIQVSPLGQWINQILEDSVEKAKQALQEPLNLINNSIHIGLAGFHGDTF